MLSVTLSTLTLPGNAALGGERMRGGGVGARVPFDDTMMAMVSEPEV